MKNPTIPGKVYLVGGAIRDKILALPHKEADYVVVGSTPEAMMAAGFTPVGKDFPVFLHPETHEEYALARTERKTARGHQGFNFHTSPDISLEEDLKRRDLTINAIAEDLQGTRFDPYHGQEDLQKKILRHVSEAFSEDPLRIFRVARFRAYLGRFDFHIAPETLKLMQTMVKNGATHELSDERIWQELLKALKTTHPELFFITLQEVGALTTILPKLTVQGLTALKRAKKMTEDPLIRFAALSFEGPYLLKYPNEFKELHQLVNEHLAAFTHYTKLTLAQKLNLLHALDYLRRETRADNYLQACLAITENTNITQALKNALQQFKNIDRAQLAQEAKQQNLNPKTYIQEQEQQLLQNKI